MEEMYGSVGKCVGGRSGGLPSMISGGSRACTCRRRR